MPIYALGDAEPTIDPLAFVHPDSVIIGNVIVGPEASIWPTTVLRGDHGTIRVGAQSSVQDGTIVHCTSTLDTTIGQRCTVGHNVHLEGCVIEDDCLIGSGSVVLHEAVVRSGALVGANALVPNGMEVPGGAMALGVPAKIREDSVDPRLIKYSYEIYVRNSHWYNKDLRRID